MTPVFRFKADNSDIVCADSCKDTIFILANNHGIKTPEEFGILACHHFLSKYRHMTNVCLTIEDLSWNRISYNDDDDDDDVKTIGDGDGNSRTKLHNHAFIHTPECIRTCSVTLNRKGLKVSLSREFAICHWKFSFSLDTAPNVVSGIKNLRLVKTSKATFFGTHRDEYKTLPDMFDRILRLAMQAFRKKHRMINSYCCILAQTWNVRGVTRMMWLLLITARYGTLQKEASLKAGAET